MTKTLRKVAAWLMHTICGLTLIVLVVSFWTTPKLMWVGSHSSWEIWCERGIIVFVSIQISDGQYGLSYDLIPVESGSESLITTLRSGFDREVIVVSTVGIEIVDFTLLGYNGRAAMCFGWCVGLIMVTLSACLLVRRWRSGRSRTG